MGSGAPSAPTLMIEEAVRGDPVSVSFASRWRTRHRTARTHSREIGRGVFGTLVAVLLVMGLSAPVAQADDTKSTVLFVVDTSGSMYGVPLNQAKEALHAGIDALAPGQAAGLRSFAGGCGQGGQFARADRYGQ